MRPILGAAVLFGTVFCSAIRAEDTQSCLTSMENVQRAPSPGALRKCAQQIETEGKVGDDLLLKRLMMIAIQPQFAVRVRIVALNLACSKANTTQAEQVLKEITTLADALDVAYSSGGTADSVRDNNTILLTSFALDGIKRIQRVTESHLSLLNLAARIHLSRWSPLEARNKALEFIANGPASMVLRRDVAFQLIERNPDHEQWSDCFVLLFDESTFPKLRTIMLRSPKLQINLSAASILAHLGDQEIEETLRKKAKSRSQSGSIIDYYLWQIAVQETPSKLLEFIAAPPIHDTVSRMWAIRRAVQLGIPKSSIRESVLKHADLVAPRGNAGVRPGLISIKLLCIELKVLKSSDLPKVLIPKVLPEH